MDNFRVIYRILRYLEKALDYDEVDIDFISASKLGISEHRWSALVEMLAKEGYVTGVRPERTAHEEALIDYLRRRGRATKRPFYEERRISASGIRITMKGLEYLRGNPLMKKAANLAKGIAEVVP